MRTDDGSDTFELDADGYIGLSLGAAADDINAGISDETAVAFDAVKFEPVTNTSNDALVWETGAYNNNQTLSKWLGISNAKALQVNIIGRTEEGYDFVHIYDSDGKEVRTVSGVINDTFVVQGASIRATLVSDYSETYAGVKVSVTPVEVAGNDGQSQALTYLEKCRARYSEYTGAAVGAPYSCGGDFICLQTAGGTAGAVTAIGIDKNANSQGQFWYYWGQWQSLALSTCL